MVSVHRDFCQMLGKWFSHLLLRLIFKYFLENFILQRLSRKLMKKSLKGRKVMKSLGNNWCSPANELMRGGVSWIVSNVHVTYWGLQSLETHLSSRAWMKFGIQQSMKTYA